MSMSSPESRASQVANDLWILQRMAEMIKSGNYEQATLVAETLARKLKAQSDLSRFTRTPGQTLG